MVKRLLRLGAAPTSDELVMAIRHAEETGDWQTAEWFLEAGVRPPEGVWKALDEALDNRFRKDESFTETDALEIGSRFLDAIAAPTSAGDWEAAFEYGGITGNWEALERFINAVVTPSSTGMKVAVANARETGNWETVKRFLALGAAPNERRTVLGRREWST